jgi:hypothetical protein
MKDPSPSVKPVTNQGFNFDIPESSSDLSLTLVAIPLSELQFIIDLDSKVIDLDPRFSISFSLIL